MVFAGLFGRSDELANESHSGENPCRPERLVALLCSPLGPSGHFHCFAVDGISKRDPEQRNMAGAKREGKAPRGNAELRDGF